MLEGAPVAVKGKTEDGKNVEVTALPGVIGEDCSIRADISTGGDGFLNIKAGATLTGKMSELYDLGDQCRRFCIEHWRMFYRGATEAVREERAK